VDALPLNFRGETGAQSSVIPTVVAFLKVPHRQSMLTDHLADMRRFMPREHRMVIEQVERLPDLRGKVAKVPYNDALEALATFRETHLEFARRYIAAHVRDPRGTGGTPYLEWLSQLIDETRAHLIL
jgi:indoleamine 2,3-dioxygenase